MTCTVRDTKSTVYSKRWMVCLFHMADIKSLVLRDTVSHGSASATSFSQLLILLLPCELVLSTSVTFILQQYRFSQFIYYCT